MAAFDKKTTVSQNKFSSINNKKVLPGSIKQVYGAQHPPIQEPLTSVDSKSPKKTKSRESDYHNFQKSTNDAWDDTLDESPVVPSSLPTVPLQLNMEDVKRTAMQVMRDHSESERKRLEQAQQVAFDERKIVMPVIAVKAKNTSPRSAGSSSPSGSSPATVNQRRQPGMPVRLSSQPKSKTGSEKEQAKLDKIKQMLAAPNVNLDEFRTACWSGIPWQCRPAAWKILSGYLPVSTDRRELTLQRKRQEYQNLLAQVWPSHYDENNQETFRQIHIDVPRMNPLLRLFQQQVVQEFVERVLYIWAIRHPASGYVQGINDLVTPFFVVFLAEYLETDVINQEYDFSTLPANQRQDMEADCFWCFSKLLDGIQDNYTFAQPGIQAKIKQLSELVSRIDGNLHHHLEVNNVEYLQFAFRWMNNLLMREVPLHCVVRLWDTYLCEPDGFASFHLYVCAAFLTRFSQQLLRERDFQGLMMHLQSLPTRNWTDEEVGLLLADAYRLKYTFADAPKHLAHASNSGLNLAK